MIQLKDISFSYPKSNFRFEIPSLEIGSACKMAIIGPSGSGKTTLLNLLSGILKTEYGNIIIEETNISKLNKQALLTFRIQNFGQIFQNFELIEYLNGLDNILHPYRISSYLELTKEVKQRATELSNRCGIYSILNKKPAQLSSGEKQRIAVCRALLPKPKIILSDEATSNLDTENTRLIMDILGDYVSSENATLIATTHNLQLVDLFDQVLDFNQLRKS